MLEAIIIAIPALLRLILMVVDGIKGTPAERRVEFINQLADGIKRVKDENNPEALARFISRLK